MTSLEIWLLYRKYNCRQLLQAWGSDFEWELCID